ncbi:MAG TPA: hypothetical protein VN461_11725 [Vicinamibacteria bacterium]|jgi:hypothetical protein|nr:hypothetical protein [Vicinamibacteria bacterium]
MTERAPMDLVERVLVESGVDRTVPPPGWGGYLRALAEAFAEWLRRSFPGFRGLTDIPTKLGPLVSVLLALVLVLIVAALVRMVVQTRRARRMVPAAPELLPARAASVPERDRAAWRLEIDRRLAAGDVAGALEAIWWWFARSVSAIPVDQSWTSRELLVRCDRGDLAPQAWALDRLLYGAERPDSERLRLFLRGLEEALP